MLATKRARQIAEGVEPLLPTDNDKPTVVALREIAEGLITNENVDPEPEAEEPEMNLEQALAEELAADAKDQPAEK